MNGENSGKEGFSGRYTEFLDYFRLTPNSLAKELGDSGKVKYYNWQQGLGEPNSESLRQIALKFPVSIDWLVLGVGPMIRGEVQSTSPDSKYLAEENQKLRDELDKYRTENGEMKNEIREYAKDFRKLTVNFTKASSQSTAFAPQYDHNQQRLVISGFVQNEQELVETKRVSGPINLLLNLGLTQMVDGWYIPVVIDTRK